MPLPHLVTMLVAAQLGAVSSLVPWEESPRVLTALNLVRGPVVFRKREREVTNWRFEAFGRLDAPLAVALSNFAGRTPANLPRCIKLNNYWCIKRAGWAGEIASDEEGHVAFSSASEGAQTAALLLRRYYVDFGRRSAAAIVSRWAPAQCGIYAGQATRLPRPGARVARSGLANTLRGRWLAAHGGRVVGRVVSTVRRSVVPDYSVQMIRAPSIVAGVSEIPASSASLGTSNLAMFDQVSPAASRSAARLASAPTFSCASETQRINNYAARASAGITAHVTDDLQLFTPDGSPLPNLEKIMFNMASVEIGPWKVDRTLIQSAIVKADETRLALQASRKAAAKALREAGTETPRNAAVPAGSPATPPQPHRKPPPDRNAVAERPGAATR